MSRNLTLEHHYALMPNNKHDVGAHLMDFADCDCDFNGENGLEYLWEEAEGFESNAAYCLSIAENEQTPKEMVEKFISLWMGKDRYYYDYDLGILIEDDKLFMSLAYEIGY